MHFKEIICEKALATTNINLASHSINPYRGCSFGCFYCYSQKNKTARKNKEAWGNFVDIKINILDRLKKELELTKPEKVILGSITEPFQAAEDKYRLSYMIIELLTEKRIPLVILSKASLKMEYIDLLKKNPELTLFYTINSPLVRELFEKESPALEERIKILKLLKENNIKTVIYVSPFFPEITDFDSLYVKENLSQLNFEIHLEWMNFHIPDNELFLSLFLNKKLNTLHNFYRNFLSSAEFKKEIFLREKKKLEEFRIKTPDAKIILHFNAEDPYFRDIVY